MQKIRGCDKGCKRSTTIVVMALTLSAASFLPSCDSSTTSTSQTSEATASSTSTVPAQSPPTTDSVGKPPEQVELENLGYTNVRFTPNLRWEGEAGNCDVVFHRVQGDWAASVDLGGGHVFTLFPPATVQNLRSSPEMASRCFG